MNDFCAVEGARLAPPHDLTATASVSSPETASSLPGRGESGVGDESWVSKLLNAKVEATFVDFCWVLALGVGIGLAIGLVAFVATVAVVR